MPVSFGALRFNTDSNKLELYDGNQWTEIVASSPDSQTGGARGVFMGGIFPTPSATNIIDYITISTTGNSIDFGDLLTGKRGNAACASSTRGISAGGRQTPSGTIVNEIQYVTISSTGNAQDFGDLTQARESLYGCSSATRGIFAGGYNPGFSPVTTVNTIEYITIASDGVNAQDFGDLTDVRRDGSSCASSTRGIFAGGYKTAPTQLNIIEFITISTLGNAADFGDLISARRLMGAASNSTRGLFAGGGPEGGIINTIEYTTIATLGNTIDFGDLTQARRELSGVASSTRGVFAQGVTPTTEVNTIDYVTIMSTGNAIDFGDTINSKVGGLSAACSNAHGGL